MKTIKNKLKGKRNGVMLGLLLFIIFSSFGFYQIYASTPRATVVSYGTGSSSGLTTGQLLEVKTSGFSKEAYLEYTYENKMETEYRYDIFQGSETNRSNNWIYVFDHNRSYEYHVGTYNKYVETNQTKTYTDKFFAWRYAEWGRGTITITVTDVNPESSTHTLTASTTVNGLGLPNLSRDINAGIGTMIKGKGEIEIRNLMATGGMPKFSKSGVTVIESHIEKFEPKSLPSGMTTRTAGQYGQNGFVGNDYYITATESGVARIHIGEKRSIIGDNFYQNGFQVFRWDYGHPEGDFDIYIFDHEPSISSGLKTITLTDTIQGVTYTCGYESYTATKDGQEIVFGEKEGTDGFLIPGKDYLVEMVKRVNGKDARYMMKATTRGTSYITYDFNGVTPKDDGPLGRVVPYKGGSLRDKVISAKGYDFLGWNSEPDGTGINYSQEIVDQEYLTVYAQWKKRFYDANVTLELDGQPYQDATVDFYQNGKKIYELKNDAGSNVYKVSHIEFSTYAENDGAYDIYINDVDSENDFIMTGDEVDGTLVSQNIYCFKGKVEITNNSLVWSNQKVVFNKLGKEYTAIYNPDTTQYEYMFVYGTATPNDGPYQVHVSDKFIQNGNKAIELTITNEVIKNKVELSYYSANIIVKKDSVAWPGRTVTLRQNGIIMLTLTYNATTGKYENEGILDFGQSYDLYIEGTNSSENVNVAIDRSNKNPVLEYYTVSFKDTVDTTKAFNTQVILSGDTARKPSSPVMEGNTFSYWATQQDGSGDKYFQSGLTTTPTITSKTDIWAIWVQPSMKIGSYIRCNANGTDNSKGLYYRLGNVAILGYPGATGKNPIRTIELEITQGSGTITVNSPGSYKVEGNDTKKIVIMLPSGASMSGAEDFIKKNIVVKPNANETKHEITARIFGVTG